MRSKSLDYLTQKQRLVIVLFYGVALVLVSKLLTGDYVATDANGRLWMLSALGYCFLTLLSAPWFLPPRDALANAIAAAILLMQLDLSSAAAIGAELNAFRLTSVLISLIVVITSVVAVFSFKGNESEPSSRSPLSRVCFRISDRLGAGEIVFTPPVLIGIVAYYQYSWAITFWLVALWFLIIIVKPLEFFVSLISVTLRITNERKESRFVGEILRIDHPNLVRVTLESLDQWKRENPLVACYPDSTQRTIIPVTYYFQGGGIVGTGLCSETLPAKIDSLQMGYVYSLGDRASHKLEIAEALKLPGGGKLVGIVVEGSTIGSIQFEVIDDSMLHEGTLVCCKQRNTPVYYQVLNARTDEELINKNPGGRHIATAAQLGSIDSSGKFKKFGWLPRMNDVVFVPGEVSLPPADPTKEDEFVVGTVPDSQIPVRAGFNDLLEYHTAILGVTGTGKTELAFDIIEKALSLGTKVFCVDFTQEYRARLSKHGPQALGLSEKQAADLNDRLFDVDTGKFGAPEEKRILQSFLEEMRAPIKEELNSFLSSEGPSLGVFELPEIINTKATLRATELYLSSIMKWARANRKARRILVVLEEAHTIIPETAGAGFDYDTQWVVSRISQIALQGRKYGVGLLLISQRTALVSKSILSQCNTHFTFSLIDKTSLDFLANVHSPAHVRLIPNLEFLEAVVFGRAIRSERPVQIRLPFDQSKKNASSQLDRSLSKKVIAH